MGGDFVRKALLLYNPNSGNNAVSNKLDYILERFITEDIILTPYRLSESNFVKVESHIKESSYSSIIVSGGDGTVNFLINMLQKNKINIPVGIIPSGTCNDYARCIGMTGRLKEDIDIILAGDIIDSDIGLVNDTAYFANTFACGNFVGVAYGTEANAKKNFGALAYYFNALMEMVQIKSYNIKIEFEGNTVETAAIILILLNGKHAAGLTNVAKNADICDGLMDILVVKNILGENMPQSLIDTLTSSLTYGFWENSNIIKIRTRECIISGDANLPFTIDGEEWNAQTAHVKFIKGAQTVVVNKKLICE
jgi:YegS/Rv2252/BmrU family lipid kinase